MYSTHELRAELVERCSPSAFAVSEDTTDKPKHRTKNECIREAKDKSGERQKDEWKKTDAHSRESECWED